MHQESISIILPAKNEARNIRQVLQDLTLICPQAEIIVVNDGSTDDTEKIADKAGVRVISHPYSMGNGAAVKTGARNATGDILIFMDADGQHNPEDIPDLIGKLGEGYDMVVGARRPETHANLFRRIANSVYNLFASIMTGHKIQDLTSGFRAVRATRFLKFLYLLPNGFSYPTTSTMAFFRSAFPVAYIPIHAGKRKGRSHIRVIKDGVRFIYIILRIGTLFSPMRLFLPISMVMFFMGAGFYGYTFYTAGRFTNMGLLLLLSSIFMFLMGVVTELISALHYKGVEESRIQNIKNKSRNDV